MLVDMGGFFALLMLVEVGGFFALLMLVDVGGFFAVLLRLAGVFFAFLMLVDVDGARCVLFFSDWDRCSLMRDGALRTPMLLPRQKGAVGQMAALAEVPSLVSAWPWTHESSRWVA